MTKTLIDIIERTSKPEPWSEGDNIPWNDPEFSERMLKEHLSQDHELASRKTDTIEAHVDWIFSHILSGQPARLLDLGCGPGLYANRLAKRGCTCTGIDFSPASIHHAKKNAEEENLDCVFLEADVRHTPFGETHDLVMMIYGQINVFPRATAREILKKAIDALDPGGWLILEIQSREQIESGGKAPPSWYSAESGLFSQSPHLVLQENFWDDTHGASTNRFQVIDAETGAVTSYALSNEAYSKDEFSDILFGTGFTELAWFPSLSGKTIDQAEDLPVIVAKK